jgi:hypothetical protein
VTLDPAARDALVIVGVVFGGLSLLLVLVLWSRLRKLRHDYTLLQGGDSHDSFVDVVTRQTVEVQGLRQEVNAHGAVLDLARAELADAIRHVSVVRYDAFGDLGGRLSFSAALLDDGGDGLVMSSIHGRTETRLYVKGVRAGSSENPMSPEEHEAVDAALQGRPA